MTFKTINGVALAVLVATGSAVGLVPTQAWSTDEGSHMDQNARMDRIEARVLKLEDALNKQSGMMEHMMIHKQPMSEHDMGGSMGTMPPPAAPMAPAAGGMGGDM